MEVNFVGKYYCRLCETSHPDLRRHVQCPGCAQFYCEKCVEEIINVRRYQCPYCDTPLSEFPIKISDTQNQSTIRDRLSPEASTEKSTRIWTEDQVGLLKYSLENVFKTVPKEYLSKNYYLSTPYSEGYQFLDEETPSLTEIIFSATEFLKIQNLDRLNVETQEGIPILTIYLEAGPVVVIKDHISEETIVSISL